MNRVLDFLNSRWLIAIVTGLFLWAVFRQVAHR